MKSGEDEVTADKTTKIKLGQGTYNGQKTSEQGRQTTAKKQTSH